MISFLTGTVLAVALAAITWFGLNEFSQTQIQKVYNPSLNLEGLDQEYSPLRDTNREGVAGRD